MPIPTPVPDPSPETPTDAEASRPSAGLKERQKSSVYHVLTYVSYVVFAVAVAGAYWMFFLRDDPPPKKIPPRATPVSRVQSALNDFLEFTGIGIAESKNAARTYGDATQVSADDEGYEAAWDVCAESVISALSNLYAGLNSWDIAKDEQEKLGGTDLSEDRTRYTERAREARLAKRNVEMLELPEAAQARVDTNAHLLKLITMYQNYRDAEFDEEDDDDDDDDASD